MRKYFIRKFDIENLRVAAFLPVRADLKNFYLLLNSNFSKLKTKSTENSHVIFILDLFSIGKKFESKCLFLYENQLSKMKLFDVDKFFFRNFDFKTE